MWVFIHFTLPDPHSDVQNCLRCMFGFFELGQMCSVDLRFYITLLYLYMNLTQLILCTETHHLWFRLPWCSRSQKHLLQNKSHLQHILKNVTVCSTIGFTLSPDLHVHIYRSHLCRFSRIHSLFYKQHCSLFRLFAFTYLIFPTLLIFGPANSDFL